MLNPEFLQFEPDDEMGLSEKEFSQSQEDLKKKVEHYAATAPERQAAELNKPTRYYLVFAEGNRKALELLQDDRLYLTNPAFANIQKPKMDQIDPQRQNEGIFLEFNQVSATSLADVKRFFEQHGLHVTEEHPVVHEQAREAHPPEFTMPRPGANVVEMKPKQSPETPDIHRPKAA